MSTALPILTTHGSEIPPEERGFGALAGTGVGALPLARFAADIQVDDLSTSWRITQEFCNSHREAIEAVYIFPLPPRAAVRSFSIRIGERSIDGRLKERGEARTEYQEAIRNSQRAALLEEDRPNIFTVQVGNILPGERIVVRIELSGLVAVEAGEATVRLPLVVAPRYIPGPALGDAVGAGTAEDTTLVPDASRISPPVLLPGFRSPIHLAITVSVLGSVPISHVQASLPTTEEDARMRTAASRRTFRLVPGQRLDRDFILRWRLGGPAVTCGALATMQGESCTLAITVVPPLEARSARPRDVVVVLDRSGSMEGWKMVAARRAAGRLVDSLGPQDRFAVLAFDNAILTPEVNAQGLCPGSDRNRFAALSFLSTLESAGGTEMEGALDRAFQVLGPDTAGRERVLVLVTDGQIGNEDHLLQRFAGPLQATRIIALGIDQAVNESVLMRLAEPGGVWWA